MQPEDNQVKNAINKIVQRFRQVDPRWICSEHDQLGMYMFLTGNQRYTMEEAIPDVQQEVDFIIETVGSNFRKGLPKS